MGFSGERIRHILLGETFRILEALFHSASELLLLAFVIIIVKLIFAVLVVLRLVLRSIAQQLVKIYFLILVVIVVSIAVARVVRGGRRRTLPFTLRIPLYYVFILVIK